MSFEKPLRPSLFIWPFINLCVIYFLLSRRSIDSDTDAAPDQRCKQKVFAKSCPFDCSYHGPCVEGRCLCDPEWTGVDCSVRQCPHNCSGHGTCISSRGVCLCKRPYAGSDCSQEVAEMTVKTTIERVGRPFDSDGRYEDEVDLMMNYKSARKYARLLCHSEGCYSGWHQALTGLNPLLPKDAVTKWQFKSCAIVSSSRHLVPEKQPEEQEAHGAEIDKHTAVFRFENAPTAGYEKWVGSRTTHRLVSGEYAKMVQTMLGTEIIFNQTKSVVTASTWWNGGYPSVEKVTYIMASQGLYGKSQMKAPDHSLFAPIAYVFPGNRHYILSPLFIKRVGDMHDRVRDVVKGSGLGCYKGDETGKRMSHLLLAVMLSLQ
ncbi:hypothetical protein CYMTET_41449, partial [Cymbomonas tetramitiformis]